MFEWIKNLFYQPEDKRVKISDMFVPKTLDIMTRTVATVNRPDFQLAGKIKQPFLFLINAVDNLKFSHIEIKGSFPQILDNKDILDKFNENYRDLNVSSKQFDLLIGKEIKKQISDMYFPVEIPILEKVFLHIFDHMNKNNNFIEWALQTKHYIDKTTDVLENLAQTHKNEEHFIKWLINQSTKNY